MILQKTSNNSALYIKLHSWPTRRVSLFFALLFNIHAKSYSTLHLFFIPYGIPGMVMLLLCEVGTHLSDGSSFFLRTPSEFPSYSMASNSQVSDFGTDCIAFPSASIYAQSVGWSKFQKSSQSKSIFFLFLFLFFD